MCCIHHFKSQVPKLIFDSAHAILCTDKKENQIFLIYKKIQNGGVAKSFMRKGFLIYEEMRKYLTIYEEAVRHLWLCNCSILDFLIYEVNIILFFISVCCLRWGKRLPVGWWAWSWTGWRWRWGGRRRGIEPPDTTPGSTPGTPPACQSQCNQREGEYKERFHLRGFCHYLHREVDAGRQGCKTTKYKSRDTPLLPLLNVMYCVRVSLWTVKIFLAHH